jgi:hypothetical protein
MRGKAVHSKTETSGKKRINMAEQRKIALDQIHVDGGTQTRESVNEEAMEGYAEAMKEGAVFPPVVVYDDSESLWLSEGFHRYGAAKIAGLVEISAQVRKGSRRDAFLNALSANAKNGLLRTKADKRHAVQMALEDEEIAEWSNRRIAKVCAVGETLVRGIRGELSALKAQMRGETEVLRNGKLYSMKLPKAVAKAESGPDEEDSGEELADAPEERIQKPRPRDDNGREVPDRLVAIFEEVPLFRAAIAFANKAANAFQLLQQTSAYQKLQGEPSRQEDRRVYSTLFLTAARKSEAMRPAVVCPECGGVYEPSPDNEWCQKCGGNGYLTADEAK